MDDNIKEIRIGNIFNATGGNYAGNVYDKSGLSPALSTMSGGLRQPLVIDAICVASRGRDSDKGDKTEQNFEPRLDRNTNTITSVSKDNYVVEVSV